MKKNVIGAMLLLALVACVAAQDRPSQPSDCGIETARSPAELLKAELFFKQLRNAVEKDDHAAVAGMIRFPLRVNGKPAVQNRAAFLRRYDKIFNQHVRYAVLHQRVECIFGNWQGFMAGDGDVWFDYSQHDPHFKVIAVNNSAK